MPSRAVAASTFWQMASQAVMAILSIVTTKFVAVGLSQELAGYYNSSYGYLQLFGILADFGLYAVAVREVSKAGDKSRMLGALIVVRSLISTIALGAALAIAWSVPSWRASPLSLGITIASLVPIFTLQAGILRTVFQVEYKMQYVFIAEVTHRILSTTLIAMTVLLGSKGSTDVSTLHWMLLFGGLGSVWLWFLSSIFARRLWSVRLTLDPEMLRRLFFLAAPYGLAYLCVALYRQFDVTLIALLRSDFEVQNAYYGFVQRMTDMAFIIPTFLLNSTLPALAAREGKGGETQSLLGRCLVTLLLLGTIAFLFGTLWPRALSLLLTTPQYLSTPDHPGTDTALFLVSLPMFLNGLILYGFYVLLHRHSWKRLVTTLFCGALLSIVCNLFLIPRLGFVGAAYTSNIVHVSLALALMMQAQAALPARMPRGWLVRWIGFALLTASTLFLFRPLLTSSILTLFLLGLAICFIALWAWMLGFHRLLAGVKTSSPDPALA